MPIVVYSGLITFSSGRGKQGGGTGGGGSDVRMAPTRGVGSEPVCWGSL